MFTDELAGNPAKKRADDAKARRLRAKREKETKEARKIKELQRREASVAVAPSVAANGAIVSEDIEETRASVNDGKIGEEPTAISGATAHFPESNVKYNITEGVNLAIHTSSCGQDIPHSAAQKASEQRKVRAEARARNSSATSIQSFLRSKHAGFNFREELRTAYDKRMSDLIALAGILHKSRQTDDKLNASMGKGGYVPPPANASMMALHFLSFACPTTFRKQHTTKEIVIFTGSMILDDRDTSRWKKLVQYILLPGVESDNLDLDPLLPWIESVAGRRRLIKILILSVSSIARRKKSLKSDSAEKLDSNHCCAIVDTFLRRILRLSSCTDHSFYSGGKREVVYQISRTVLTSCAPTSLRIERQSITDYIANPNLRSECDLLKSLRFILLFGSHGNTAPIPTDAARLRENCITKDEKHRISILLKFTLDLLLSMESLSDCDTRAYFSRFVIEVLTIPLLSWKTTTDSIKGMINRPKNSKAPPPLVVYIRNFINCKIDELSAGQVNMALNMMDVTLSSCPAPAALCLLGNLIQIGKQSEALCGFDRKRIHYNAAAEFFNFLTILIDSVPLGTFSSRMAAVEWVNVGLSSSPIVLSDAVIEQTSSFLSDSFVRSMFKCAINANILGTQGIIDLKTDKDRKHEKDVEDIASECITSLTAKEAMIDRNHNFWLNSKWAKKISNSMHSLISSSREKSKSNKCLNSELGAGQLMNTSSVAKRLALGTGPVNRDVTNLILSNENDVSIESSVNLKSDHEYSVLFLLSLCRAYGTIISRWGGAGREDLVCRDINIVNNSGSQVDQASGSLEPCVTALLNVLCFSTDIVLTSWAIIQSNSTVVADLYCVIDINKSLEPVRSLNVLPTYQHMRHTHYGTSEGNFGAVVLLMFVSCLSHTLIVTDDVEIHDMEKPLPKHQLRRCICLLKKLLYRACYIDDNHDKTSNSESNHLGISLISKSSRLMNELYSRSSRRLLCAPKLWIEEDLLEKDLRRCKTHYDYTALLTSPICRICPFLISFKRRLQLFERIVTSNRIDIQGSNELRNLKPGIVVKVMRGRVLEDGLIHLNNLGRNMRQRIVVNYFSQAGAQETGVDVGGLFKEFWTDLSNIAFDPNYALFRVVEGSASMYPNPSSKLAHGSDHVILFEFLGRILGKALYEGITIQPQFAHLFLSFLRGDHQYLHLLTDLSTIDHQLYNNLMFLKMYDGDVSDLCLTFTVNNDDFGVSEVPLIPNGANIEVTNENKRRYIFLHNDSKDLVAKHHVCDRIKEQADAFTRGLWEVIDRSWLRLFNEPELQVLISGASDGKIDVTDMKANTKYAGGYSSFDRNIVRFWNVVSSFSPKQQADLLRFVTSCERPPPLGFARLNPPFTVQRVGIMRDGDKLPSASTCFNTLKLPTYSSERVLKDRLLYAIQAGAGFELT